MRSWGQSAWQQTSQEYSQFVVGFNKRFVNDQFNTARFVNHWTVKPLTGSLGYERRFSGESVGGWLSKHQESLNSRFFSHADSHSVANKVGDFLAGGASDILLFGAAAKGVIWSCQAVGKLASGITAIRNTFISPIQKLTSGAGSSLSFSVTRTSTGSTLEFGKKFKPFTERNYRDNLKILTGTNPPRNIEAHHVFPQQFRGLFSGKGINIDNPKFLTWWERSSHRPSARSYNAHWESFIMNENPGASKTQILEKGKDLMSKYGRDVNY